MLHTELSLSLSTSATASFPASNSAPSILWTQLESIAEARRWEHGRVDISTNFRLERPRVIVACEENYDVHLYRLPPWVREMSGGPENPQWSGVI